MPDGAPVPPSASASAINGSVGTRQAEPAMIVARVSGNSHVVSTAANMAGTQTAATKRPKCRGSRRPRRSDHQPTRGCTISIASPHPEKNSPICPRDHPRRWNSSGSRISMAPNTAQISMSTTQAQTRVGGSGRAPNRAARGVETGAGTAARPGSNTAAQTASSSGSAAKYKNGSRGPPTLPSAGPATTPTLKPIISTLISTPRRSRLDRRAARGSAAAHVADAATPCVTRQPSSAQKSAAHQNPSDARPSTTMPRISRRRSPTRSTSIPNGRYSSSEIRPYEAYNMPARVSPNPNSATKVGSAGMMSV